MHEKYSLWSATRSFPYLYTVLNWTTREKTSGWKFHHLTSCTQIFVTSSLPNPYNPIESHHSVTLSSGNFSSVLGHIKVPRVTFSYLLGDGNNQSTYKDREKKVDHGESSEWIGEIFRSWILELSESDCTFAFSSLAFERDEEKSSSKCHFRNIEIRNPHITSNPKNRQTSKSMSYYNNKSKNLSVTSKMRHPSYISSQKKYLIWKMKLMKCKIV